MNRVQHLLVRLAEEASELSQIALKTAQYGVHNKEPGQEATNLQKINAEFNDIIGVIRMLDQEAGLNISLDEQMISDKIDRVKYFRDISVSGGLVQNGF